uniref:ARID domain-containing protein n=1 Tax=Strongyloides stercoralis TaxID=6248 RepID=A0A0K0DSI6_STRER
MADYPSFKIAFENEDDLVRIENLAQKLHCAMKWSGSQLVTVENFKKWLLRYKKELSISEEDIDSVVSEDTPYGWSSVTNFCVKHLFFVPYKEEIKQNNVFFYEQFIVLRKVTLYDFKFDPDSCTAAIDKCEAKMIKRIGINNYNKFYRPEILEIQKNYYSEIDSLPPEMPSSCGADKEYPQVEDENTPIPGDTDDNLSPEDDLEESENLTCCEINLFIKDFFSISPCNFSEALMKINNLYMRLGIDEEEEFNGDELTQEDIDTFLSIYQRLLNLHKTYLDLTLKSLL